MNATDLLQSRITFMEAELAAERSKNAEQSLAEKAYGEDRVSMQVYDEVCNILGHPHVADTWVDGYDGSIEIILGPDAAPMTRDEADKVLTLGFGQIYESQGERGTNWFKGHVGACSPRKAGEESKSKISKWGKALAAEQEKTAKLETELTKAVAGRADANKPARVLGEENERLTQALRESQAGAAALRAALQSLCDALNIHHFSKLERQKAVDDAFHASHIALATTAGASLIARLAELEALVAGLEHDRERLNYVEELIRNCPHAEITFNDDSDMDELLGFIIRVEGCETSESVGITFREAIDQDRASEIERRKA